MCSSCWGCWEGAAGGRCRGEGCLIVSEIECSLEIELPMLCYLGTIDHAAMGCRKAGRAALVLFKFCCAALSSEPYLCVHRIIDRHTVVA
jgi:hypothetical protein